MAPNDSLVKLLSHCARGDQRAFARLYRQSAPQLYAVALRLTRTRERAEEVLQEAFINIWHNACRYHEEKGSAMAWMVSIVRYRALDRLRRDRHETTVEQEPAREDVSDSGLDPLETISETDEHQALLSCMQQLKVEQRQSIVLAYLHGYTHQELSERMKVPLGTVKSWIRRGLQHLKRCLSDEIPES
jgi:RNA polymerase sigma factor, sigma-70 family